MLFKNLIVIVVLFGLIGWGIYEHTGKDNQKKVVQQVTTQSNAREVSKGVKIGVATGDIAPDFQLTTLDGKVVKLSEYKGKIVFLNFWASWCPPCKAEMPHMEDFYKEQNSHAVEILAVNWTTQEKSKEDVAKFVSGHGLTFPVLLDQEGKVGDTYQAFTIPTTYIIDKNGIIQKKIVGPLSKEMMNKIVSSLQ